MSYFIKDASLLETDDDMPPPPPFTYFDPEQLALFVLAWDVSTMIGILGHQAPRPKGTNNKPPSGKQRAPKRSSGNQRALKRPASQEEASTQTEPPSESVGYPLILALFPLILPPLHFFYSLKLTLLGFEIVSGDIISYYNCNYCSETLYNNHINYDSTVDRFPSTKCTLTP